MGELVLDLVPLALGVVFSPLAIMALVAVLLSNRARVNGIAFLVGWALAITAILALSFGFLGQFKPTDSAATPVWVSVLHVVVGLLLVAAGVWQSRKGRTKLHAMAQAASPAEVVAAAPQLPGWLHAVETFTAGRSLVLGFGIFALNPVDLSCALIAGIDIAAAGLSSPAAYGLLVAFAIIGLLPIAIPVVLILVLGTRADPFLEQSRGWIGSHNGILNASVLMVIGALQLQKGLSALIG